MTIAHPRRLRAERALPRALCDALRELPNAPPESAQLDELRQRLGLAASNGTAGQRPAPMLDRRQRERRLRRTVVALVFFPVAATAAVGSVIEFRERSVRSAAMSSASALAPSSSGVTRRAPQPPSHGASAQSASSLAPVPESRESPVVQDVAANAPRHAHAASTPPSASAREEPTTLIADSELGSAPEVELLQRANAALKSDPAGAQRLVAEHRRRFPSGNLAQEREVIAIKAWLALGDSPRAKENLTRFEHAYPHSAYAVELRQIVH